jgi:hypothetical protein
LEHLVLTHQRHRFSDLPFHNVQGSKCNSHRPFALHHQNTRRTNRVGDMLITDIGDENIRWPKPH